MPSKNIWSDINTWMDMSFIPIDMPWFLDSALMHRPPAELYHYTKPDGLLGILNGQRMWASDALYLNDASELRYAAAVVVEVLRDFSEESNSGAFTALVLETLRKYEAHREPATYVTCFSENGDQLSQWRAYATPSGFSVGTRVQLWRFPERGPLSVRKVVYDRAKQEDIIRDLFSNTREQLDLCVQHFGEDETRTKYVRRMSGYLSSLLAELSVYFKHPSFEEEKEWRVVFVPSRDQTLAGLMVPEVKFRASKIGFVPFVELPLHPRAGTYAGRLPIFKVIAGPGTHAELAVPALSALLQKHMYTEPDTEAMRSQSPLRE